MVRLSESRFATLVYLNWLKVAADDDERRYTLYVACVHESQYLGGSVDSIPRRRYFGHIVVQPFRHEPAYEPLNLAPLHWSMLGEEGLQR